MPNIGKNIGQLVINHLKLLMLMVATLNIWKATEASTLNKYIVCELYLNKTVFKSYTNDRTILFFFFYKSLFVVVYLHIW